MGHVTTVQLAIAAGASMTALVEVLRYRARSILLARQAASARVAERAVAATLWVSEVTDRTAFMELEAEWNALVHATSDEPFYRHEWFRIWLDSFAPKAKLRT